jgi:hypothetical protein
MTDPDKPRTMKWAMRVSGELRAENGDAEAWLRHKCSWEKMSRTAVLLSYGDPREWPDGELAACLGKRSPR